MKEKREIKFRAWDNSQKNFHYPKLWDKSMPSNWEHWYQLQQYTGLRDKNGIDIYEGDIIRLHEYQGEVYKEVVFHNGCFCVHGFNWERKSVEVIGNVHQNHDIL